MENKNKMITVIGEVAGKIWHYFDTNGNIPVSIANLAKKIGHKKDEVIFGIGWLAREGKINIETNGSTVKVSIID